MQSASAAFGTIVAGNEMVVEHAVSIELPLYRRNMASTPNFENGLGLWRMAGSSSTLALSTTHAVSGVQSMKVTWATMGAFTGGPFLRIPDAKPGKTYAVMAKVWLDTAGPPVQIVNMGSNNTVSTRGSWQLLWGVVTPTDYTNNEIWIMPTAAVTAGAGVAMWVDTVMYWEQSTPPTGLEYFDGDSPNASWLGIAGLSESLLNLDPYPTPTNAVQSIRISRQLTTDAPASTRMISGYASATATVILGGMVGTDESQDAAWLFGPDETTSPIWGISADGSPVSIQQGIYTSTGAELLTTFTGFIDDVLVDNVTRDVTIIALDPMTKLRNAVTIPPVANVNQAYGHNPGVTAAWALEYLLRQNGYYAGPPPRPTCIMYASMHGSAWPEVMDGFSDATPTPKINQSLDLFQSGASLTNQPQDFLATLAPGVWSQQVVRHPSLVGIPFAGTVAQRIASAYSSPTPNIGAAGSFFFDGWLMFDNSVASTAAQSYFGINSVDAVGYVRVGWAWSAGATTATPTLTVNRASGGPTSVALTGSIPVAGWPHVSCLVLFTGSTTATVTLIVDGTIYTTNVTGLPAAGSGLEVATSGDFVWLGWADTIQITNEMSPSQINTFSPNAIIDSTLNPLLAVPDPTGQSAKDVVTAIASAEMGVAGFDELGTFRFSNRTTIFGTTSSRVVSASSSLKAFQSDDGMAAVATHVQVPASPLVASLPVTVWQAQELIKVPRFSTWSGIATTTGTIIAPVANDSGYVATSGGGPPGSTYWRAARQPNGLTAISSGVTVRATPTSTSMLAVTIQNLNPYDVWMVSPQGLTDVTPGTPYVFIGGYTVSASNGVVGDSQWPDIGDGGAAANANYGNILLSIPSHPWMQDATAAQALADDLLPDTYKPKPLLTNVSVIADPRLQLADRVTFSDPDGSKMNEDVYLIGIDYTESKMDWTQQINAVRVAAPGDWIMGQTGRSEMGHTTYV